MAERATIARPYAKAAFEYARDANALAQWSEGLKATAQIVADPRVAPLTKSPEWSAADLVGLITDVAGPELAAGMQNFVRVLAENHRLLLLPEIAAHFEVLAGDIVPKKKPAPDIYLLTMERLQIKPEDAIVIEDSRNGLLAAIGAGLHCVVTLSSYTIHEDIQEAILVVSNLGDPGNPMHIIANRSQAIPGDFITLSDLEACLLPMT